MNLSILLFMLVLSTILFPVAVNITMNIVAPITYHLFQSFLSNIRFFILGGGGGDEIPTEAYPG